MSDLIEVKKPVGKYEWKDPTDTLKTENFRSEGFYIGKTYFEKVTLSNGLIKYYKLK